MEYFCQRFSRLDKSSKPSINFSFFQHTRALKTSPCTCEGIFINNPKQRHTSRQHCWRQIWIDGEAENRYCWEAPVDWFNLRWILNAIQWRKHSLIMHRFLKRLYANLDLNFKRIPSGNRLIVDRYKKSDVGIFFTMKRDLRWKNLSTGEVSWQFGKEFYV